MDPEDLDHLELEELVRQRIATQTARPREELVKELGLDIDLG